MLQKDSFRRNKGYKAWRRDLGVSRSILLGLSKERREKGGEEEKNQTVMEEYKSLD